MRSHQQYHLYINQTLSCLILLPVLLGEDGECCVSLCEVNGIANLQALNLANNGLVFVQ